jgi:urea transport system substrate-binding protein
MNSASPSRGAMLVWIVFRLLLVGIPAAHAGEETIKIGILHSLSGTMAISEAVLKDTVLMLIEDQNKKGGAARTQIGAGNR